MNIRLLAKAPRWIVKFISAQFHLIISRSKAQRYVCAYVTKRSGRGTFSSAALRIPTGLSGDEICHLSIACFLIN